MLFFLCFSGMGLLRMVGLFEDDSDADGPHHDHRADQNQRPQLSGRGQQHSCQPQNRSEHIGNGHGLLLVKAHIDEPVVDVSPVCRHGVLPLGNPPQKGEADVKDRDAPAPRTARQRK